MPTRIVMFGAGGRMGRRILSLALDDADFSIEAGVDTRQGSLRDWGIPCDAPRLDELPATAGAVVIDFSHAAATSAVIDHCAAHGMPLLIGTTGMDPAERDRRVDAAAAAIPVLPAPNTSLGVNLLLAVAARVARSLGTGYDLEIVETHHRHKRDAPSGTAWALADAVAAATGRDRSVVVCGRCGKTGERPSGEIAIHALRMGEVVGEHRAHFVGNGERIGLEHQAYDRDVFALGALRAAAFLATAEPGRYTMADVLGLD